MRLLRVTLAEGVTVFLKFIMMPLYSAWAVKLGVIDAATNPLFAVTMVLLSIYGLWVIVRKASEYLVRIIEGNGEADAVRKG